tara:strand:- start:140 stop:490 length:351 start_codon:yes stop_codon:yes gene_type:complete
MNKEIELNLTNENILRILESYKEKRIYDKQRYHNKLKKNPEYMKQRRETTAQWIKDNPERHKKAQEKSSERRKLQVKVNYYKKTNQLDKFKLKFPMLMERCLELGLLPAQDDESAI